MAKKSLKKRIDDLVDALGGAEKPTLADIRSELVVMGALAEEMEAGHTLAEKESAITALEQENENLKVELQTANTELDAFRAERKKQEEEERQKEMPEIQFQILKHLPSQHGGPWLKLIEIAYAAGIPVDETEIHLNRLQIAGLITGHYNACDVFAWHRTIAGTELVLAKRLAKEDQESPKAYKHDDLFPIQHDALLLIAKNQEGISESELLQRIDDGTAAGAWMLLRTLRTRGFVTYGSAYGAPVAGRILILAPRGTEYLRERDLL
jgi:hypothetical protein